ncbi:MAG: ribosome recycling factor [Candidatus Margulisiibacteriota bacterium]|jgi:ribosome recycling factor
MQNLQAHMQKTIDNLKHQLTSIRTGRANPEILSRIQVEYYGSLVPLKQVASIMVPESMTLQLNVFDKTAIKSIEKAILNSDLNVSPQVDGTTIRIRLPELTEERRKELVKVTKKIEEESKIALRNIRRDAMEELKKQEKNKEISEDDAKTRGEEIQKELDKFIIQVEKLIKEKEVEILKV